MRIHHYASVFVALILLTVGARPYAGAQSTSSKTNNKEATDAIERVQTSMTVLGDLTKTPDDAIPANLLSGSEAIAVIPSLVKGGFVIGAKHGRGIISARRPGGTDGNSWSKPAFVKMTGGNIGWQIGLEEVDLVLLVMNHDGIDNLLSDKFTLGGNLSVAAGPVGRSGDAATDAKLQAGILAYSRAKGLFAGATLEGAALHADDDANRAIYHDTTDLKSLLLTAPATSPTMPAVLHSWQEMLGRVAVR